MVTEGRKAPGKRPDEDNGGKQTTRRSEQKKPGNMTELKHGRKIRNDRKQRKKSDITNEIPTAQTTGNTEGNTKEEAQQMQ